MENYSSFYGGRKGDSFNIIKMYDCIDLDKSCKYRGNFYALNPDNPFEFLTIDGEYISRNAENQNNYTWKYHLHDGTDGFIEELAEGMVQDFRKGIESSVRIGDYVMINTLMGYHNYNDIDNGTIFYRCADPSIGECGGVKVGQVVGPQGSIAGITLEHASTMSGQTVNTIKVNPLNDLVPGLKEDGSFNDDIILKWENKKDEIGNIIDYHIGVKFPYLVQEVEGDFNAYNEPKVERIDDKQHPYYNKWKFTIPKGKQGVSVSNIEKIMSKVKTETSYYNNAECIGIAEGTISESMDLPLDVDYNNDISVKVQLSNNIYYVKKSDLYYPIYRAKLIDYSNTQEGESYYIKIGEFKEIDSVSLDGQNGNGTQKINIKYNNEEIEHEIGDALNYILDATVISKEDTENNWTDYYLLILYSDPARRENIPEEKKEIAESIYPDAQGSTLRNDWYNIGLIGRKYPPRKTISNDDIDAIFDSIEF